MQSTTLNQYLKHLDAIIRMHDEAVDEDYNLVSNDLAHGIIAWATSAVAKITGQHSVYYVQLKGVLDDELAPSFKAKLITGLLKGLRGELLVGHLDSLSELVHADTFASYLEMAEYLLQEDWKDAAAVIATSTLEAHLRQLAIKYEISLIDNTERPRKSAWLNDQLGKKAYKLFERNQVSTWLTLRNHAAHGHYNEYKLEDVKQLVLWLRSFITTYPA